MSDKSEFAVKILKEYAHENQIPARSTSDLSPMEQWLILRLFDVSGQSEQLVKDLAEWSRKYPRGRVYPMSKISMDDELVKLEERAVMIALRHSDNMCFHECPNCNCRCNCSNHPCSCCNEA